MNNNAADLNIGKLILKRAELDPNRTAIIFKGKEWTYKSLADRIIQLAENFSTCGIGQGDRIAYLGLNNLVYFEALFAAHYLGAIFVPLNYRLSDVELQYIINDCSPHTLITDSDHSHLISSIKEKISCKRYIKFDLEDNETDCFFEDYELVYTEKQQKALPPYKTNPDDCAIIMYTSGTTGKPKGAMLSHANIMWNNIQACFTYSITSHDTTIICAPLFHVGGLNVTTLSTLINGGRVLIHPNFDASNVIQDIKKYSVNTLFAAPAMLQMIAQESTFNNENMESLRMVVVGAAPVSKALLNQYIDQGIEINQGYGLTETSPMVTFLTPAYSESKLGSAGKTGLFGEIKIIDPYGIRLPSNTVGEILYKGPNLMTGYWQKPEATMEAISPAGWFHTGDAGYLDDEGFLFISDRIKDMVISGGENVYPAEVESVLFEHPSILDAAVIGLPHEKWGEAVTAVVVLHPGETLTLDEVREFAKPKLAKYKLPLNIYQLKELPRNPAGKVLKHRLRERVGNM